jgi:hypothetical protein
LPFLIAKAVFMLVAVVLYGWVLGSHWPVYLLLLSVALMGCFLLMISVSLASYIVDAFGL